MYIDDIRNGSKPMDRKLQAALAAASCLVSIDDNERLVTVKVPANVRPSRDIVRQWHETAGDLGYGIQIKAVQ